MPFIGRTIIITSDKGAEFLFIMVQLVLHETVLNAIMMTMPVRNIKPFEQRSDLSCLAAN